MTIVLEPPTGAGSATKLPASLFTMLPSASADRSTALTLLSNFTLKNLSGSKPALPMTETWMVRGRCRQRPRSAYHWSECSRYWQLRRYGNCGKIDRRGMIMVAHEVHRKRNKPSAGVSFQYSDVGRDNCGRNHDPGRGHGKLCVERIAGVVAHHTGNRARARSNFSQRGRGLALDYFLSFNDRIGKADIDHQARILQIQQALDRTVGGRDHLCRARDHGGVQRDTSPRGHAASTSATTDCSDRFRAELAATMRSDNSA